MPQKLPYVALLLVVVVVAWLLWRQDAELVPTPASDPTQSAESAAEVAGGSRTAADERSVDAAVADGEAVRTQATAIADGKALLRVTAKDSKGVVQPGVVVTLRPLRGESLGEPTGKRTTGEDGRCEFADVQPGTVYLQSDRNDSESVELKPGLNEIDFEVTAGIAVAGRVLDSVGKPVANATVWLQTASTGFDGGRVLGTSGADGAFAFAVVARNASLGAFATGHAPSELVDLDVVDQSVLPARVELRLRSGGGDVTGRVTDADGAPIRGAQVALGNQSKDPSWENGRFIEVWGVRTVETDADGRYALVGAIAGRNVVTARAKGFGIVRTEAAVVAGATTHLDLTLAKSSVLVGVVTDRAGKPEAGARIRAYDRRPSTSFVASGQIDFDEPFGHLETVTDERGAYRLEGISAGTTWAFAHRRREGGGIGVSAVHRHDVLEVAVGSEIRWDPVLDEGRSIEGVVRYRDGHPTPMLFVTLRDERTEKKHVINSDEHGRFRFFCLEDSTYEVLVQPPFDAPKGSTSPKRPGVVPDQAPVEFTLEYDKPKEQVPGTVRGRISDVGVRVRNAKALTVTLQSEQGWFRPGARVADGAFTIGEVEPCRFRLARKESETVLCVTGWFDLPAAGDVDVGVLTTEPGGSLRVQASRSAGAEELEPKLYLRRAEDPASTTVELGRDSTALIESLTPGEYEVACYCKRMLSVKTKAVVRAGETAELALELRIGAVGKISVWWPERRTGSTKFRYAFTDPAGAVEHQYDGEAYGSSRRPFELYYTLLAGRHHLAFRTDDGLAGEVDFEIPADLTAPEVRLDLR